MARAVWRRCSTAAVIHSSARGREVLPSALRPLTASEFLSHVYIVQAELDFFDEVTEVSGQLYPVPKDQRKAATVAALRELSVPRPDLYMPANPDLRLLSIIPESGTPMQSAAKVLLQFQTRAQEQRPITAACSIVPLALRCIMRSVSGCM